MAEPIDYRIMLNLQAALAAMTVAGGFFYDVGAAAVKLDPDHDVDSLVAPDGPRPFVFFGFGGDEDWSYQPGMRVRPILPVTIAWIHDSDGSDDASLMNTYFRGLRDVEKAIAADITRGGLATDTRIVQRWMKQSGTQVWAHVALKIDFTRIYGQG